MKVKVSQIIFAFIILHILSTQSVLLYLFFDVLGNWELKSLVHPISFVLLLSVFTLKIKEFRFKVEDIILLVYAFFLLVSLIINVDNFFSFYIAFREVFFVFILTYLFTFYRFSKGQYKFLVNFLFVLILINLFLTILTNVIGGEAFMKMLVGYYYWGFDPETKFQINYFLGVYFRSPGAIGSSAAVAYFGLLSYYIFDLKPGQNIKKFIAFILIMSTITRSAILCLVIYEILKLLNDKKNIQTLMKYMNIIIAFLIIVVLIIARNTSVFNTESLWIRIDVWFNEIFVDYNILYGGRMGQVGGAVRGEGHHAIIDSYWFFLLYCSGYLGILVWLFFYYKKAKVSRRKLFFTIGIIFSGFFITLTQAIPFLVMFPLVFASYDVVTEREKLNSPSSIQ